MSGGERPLPPSADRIQTEEGWGGARPDIVRWAVRQGLLLAAFWVLLSGHFTALLLTLGALSVLLVCWLTYRAGLPERRESALRLTVRMPMYVLWLEKEVLVSAVRVVRMVWSPRIRLDPQIGSTPATEMTALAETTYANSITLTPGTLSTHLDDDAITVHSLDRSGLDDLHAGQMLRLVRRLETPSAEVIRIEERDRERDDEHSGAEAAGGDEEAER